jgi:hypothetical protein
MICRFAPDQMPSRTLGCLQDGLAQSLLMVRRSSTPGEHFVPAAGYRSVGSARYGTGALVSRKRHPRINRHARASICKERAVGHTRGRPEKENRSQRIARHSLKSNTDGLLRHNRPGCPSFRRRDRGRILPVNPTREMILSSRSAAILKGVRERKPADIGALARMLSRLSLFAAGAGAKLRSVDLNPVLALEEGEGAFALDAIVEIAAAEVFDQ